MLDQKKSVYVPDQPGLIFPQEKTFEDPLDERHFRKERLAAACRFFARQGFGHGFGGHLTVRDPVDPDLFWTNPFCVPFSHVKVSNLILCDHDGLVVSGEYPVNKAGYILHSAIHSENPDIVASCHAHTVHGGAFASLGRPLDPISQDACQFYSDHTVLSEGAGKLPVASDSGKAMAAAFAHNKAVIHCNHGLLTASRQSIDAAAWWFAMLDHCCRMQLLVDASGIAPKKVDPEFAQYTWEQAGTEYMSWLHFQTEYVAISTEEPDLFE